MPWQHRHRLGAWQQGLRPDPASEVLVWPLHRVGCPRSPPLRRVEPGEGEEPAACCLEAIGDSLAREPPLPQEGLAARFPLGPGVGMDHAPIVFGRLVVHVFRGMRQQVAMPVNRAASNGQVLAPQRRKRGFQARSNIDDRELGPLQPARIGIGEEPAPGRQGSSAVLPPPLLRMDGRTFRPSRRAPMAASTDMVVAFRSRRVPMTVPSRIRRRTAPLPRRRAHHVPRSTMLPGRG